MASSALSGTTTLASIDTTDAIASGGQLSSRLGANDCCPAFVTWTTFNQLQTILKGNHAERNCSKYRGEHSEPGAMPGPATLPH